MVNKHEVALIISTGGSDIQFWSYKVGGKKVIVEPFKFPIGIQRELHEQLITTNNLFSQNISIIYMTI